MRTQKDEAEPVANSIEKLAAAILPPGICGAQDENGGYVSSLTEAVMSCSASLGRIAVAISELSETVNNRLIDQGDVSGAIDRFGSTLEELLNDFLSQRNDP